jgi:hypothetical protein
VAREHENAEHDGGDDGVAISHAASPGDESRGSDSRPGARL